MLSFVQSWFAPRANPIGVDFGSECLRMAQVQSDGSHHKLVAAASCDLPDHARLDPEARLDFFVETVGELLERGRFRGRAAVLSLPSSQLFLGHFRLPKAKPSQTSAAIKQMVQSTWSIDPAESLVRQLPIAEGDDAGLAWQELLVMAATRDSIDRYLAAAQKAGLDVVGIKAEPTAVIDCFRHVYRRQRDGNAVSLFVDLGAHTTRATIAQGDTMLMAHTIPLGGVHFNQAVAAVLGGSQDDAHLRRLKAAQDESTTGDREPAELDAACEDIVSQIANDLKSCRQRHEKTFPQKLVQRMIFVGGEAKHRSIREQIIHKVGLPGQIGDPLIRMARVSDISIESGIDRRLPQPAWAVAIGLSFDHSASVSDRAATATGAWV